MSETTPCPQCGQQTAPQYFREVGKRRLCVLCAQSSEEAERALEEAVEDHKLHGGYGWLWKHIGWVIASFLGYFFFRGIIDSVVRALFRALFGGN